MAGLRYITTLVFVSLTAASLGACGGSDDAEQIERLERTVSALQTAGVQATPTATPSIDPTPTAMPTCGLPELNAAIEAVVRVETQSGTGSGFFVSPNTVVTNRHVVDNVRDVQLQTASGAVVPATVVAVSDWTDIAILDTDFAATATLQWATFGEVVSGQPVYAIGYPLGVTGAPVLTRGIVSRAASDEGLEIVQTDAALNPGNSGGPLVNDCGQVVGINTAKPVDSEGFGLAIGSGTAETEALALAAGGGLRPSEGPPVLAFSSPEDAVAFVWEWLTAGDDAEVYSGRCSPSSPFQTWCSFPVLATGDFEIHSIGMVATSIFAGMVMLRADGDAYYLLGWDPAKTVGSGQRQVSGLTNCLNERANPGTGGSPLRCHPPGTLIATTDAVAWVDGYLWLETDTGNWMAARWLCLEIHCPYGTVPDTTWVFGR